MRKVTTSIGWYNRGRVHKVDAAVKQSAKREECKDCYSQVHVLVTLALSHDFGFLGTIS
jgi:hypothetical protein